MQFFVRRYDGADSPHDGYEKIEANSPKDAAEKACGETLTEEGKPMRLRATVRVRPILPPRHSTPCQRTDDAVPPEARSVRWT